MTQQKPLVITTGEPAGIGPEILLKAWQARRMHHLPPFFVLHDPDFLQQIRPDIPLTVIKKPAEALDVFHEALPVYPVSLAQKVTPGRLNPANAKAVIKSIETAVMFCRNGDTAGMVTLPVHKANLYESGLTYQGHTEFIADLCGQPNRPVMMLIAQDLKVVPLTIHVPLKEVPTSLTQDFIIRKVRIIHEALHSDFKMTNPRIAVCGLNPHAGEDGTIGTEDRDMIAPALAVLQKENIQAGGPYPADTLFHEEARKNYEVAVGMYHDQVLIPVKTLDFYGGVNITLGLRIVRTSPDHGTALDIAGRGIARADSLCAALQHAAHIARNRADG